MLNKELLEAQLSELPLYVYHFFDPKELEFTDRVRWICEHECPMYGTSWACPPAVGTVSYCKAKCLKYANALLISTITEVADIANIDETLATRPDHEAVTNQVRDLSGSRASSPTSSPPRAAPSASAAPGWTGSPAITRSGCTPVWRATASTSCPSSRSWV